MSSYSKNNYDLVFKALVFSLNPKKIVEIGVLDGFSLESMALSADSGCDIYAYDLFEDYNYEHRSLDQIKEKFLHHKNVTIKKSDFKQIYKFHTDNSMDILHVDVSNNGDTYEFCLDKYFPKISQGGIIILEGGSKERDEVDWMNKFNFPKIRPVIEKIEHNTLTLEAFPSLTIIKK